jgi:hypothetical protein
VLLSSVNCRFFTHFNLFNFFIFIYEFSVAEIIYFHCSSFLLYFVFLFSSFVSVNNHKNLRFCCYCC